MLGDNIKELMKIKKITSKEIADITGVTPTHISYILNNKRQPSLDLVEKIAEILKVSVNELFDNINDNSKVTKENNYNSIEKDLPVVPEEFADPKEARAYVDKHQIFGSEGFDADRLDDKEILEFANALLEQMRMVSYKYKK